MGRSDAEILQAYKQFYIDDYHAFVKKAFQITNAGDVFIDNWHIKYITDLLQFYVNKVGRREKKEHNLIINIPPRSLKSSMVSIDLPAWAWLSFPGMKFINTSYGSPLSVEHNMKTRRIIESRWYQSFAGITLAKDQKEKGKFENSATGSRSATSVGSSDIMGTGANIIVIDDPQSPKNASSELDRKKVITYFKETLTSRLNNPDIDMFIIVMQRLHENDLVGYLMEEEPHNWRLVSIPAEISGHIHPESLKSKYKNGLMFPERFSRKVLDNFKNSLGSYGYSGQYLQMPTPPEGGILKKKWFYKIGVKDIPENITWHLFLDTAYTENTKNDPTGFLVVGNDVDNKRIIIKKFVSKFLEMPKLLKELPQIMKREGCTEKSYVYVEPKASGLSLMQLIRNQTYINIVAIKNKLVGVSKMERANYIAPYAESSRIALVSGNWNDAYIHEVTSFPNAPHDESIDTTAYACIKFLHVGQRHNEYAVKV